MYFLPFYSNECPFQLIRYLAAGNVITVQCDSTIIGGKLEMRVCKTLCPQLYACP